MCMQVSKSCEHLGLASEQIQRTKVIEYGVSERCVYRPKFFSKVCLDGEKKAKSVWNGIERRPVVRIVIRFVIGGISFKTMVLHKGKQKEKGEKNAR